MKSWEIIRILFFSLFAVCVYCCKPEEIILHGEISGVVTNAKTNQPLETATVILITANDTTITRSDGKYLFKGLTPGTYEIEASKQAYSKSTKNATVTSINITDIDFALDEIPVIHYSVTSLEFGFSLNSLSFTMSKTGAGKIAYIFTPGKDWITVNPGFGDVDNETDSIKVTINRTGLTQKQIKEWIIVRTSYGQHTFLDTIHVNVWFHDPIAFNPGLTYGNVTDIDGNVYKTIQIGTQTWMAENLRTTKYNDSTSIPLVTDDVRWYSLITPGYCWYDNELYYKTDFGALYNWYTANTGKLCPEGWHIPLLDNWNTLLTFLGGAPSAYFKLREMGTLHWEYPNAGVTNESGFTALPAGCRAGDDGTFDYMGSETYFWVPEDKVSDKEKYLYIVQHESYNEVAISALLSQKQDGFSLRCIKD